MHLILDTIEFGRCEGRMMNSEIFERIDTMECVLRHENTSHLSEWLSTMEQFGNDYKLNGLSAIQISQRSIDGFSHLARCHDIPLATDS